MTRHVLSMLFVTVIGLAILSEANAATIQANSCSQSSTQSAVNSASNGDTVSVPAGNCTWTSTVTIPSSKRIALMGAGTDVTVITFSPAGGTALNLSKSGSRVSGFTFREGAILVDGSNWRIDHCKLQFSAWSDGITAGSIDTVNGYNPTGVIDHCTLNNMRVLAIGTNFGLGENGTQHAMWARPLGLGSNNAVFVENCTFNGVADSVNAIDANYGGRFVFRYNTLNDIYVEAHSVQGNNRAARSWEIYNNTFNQVSKAMWVPDVSAWRHRRRVQQYRHGDVDHTAGIALDNVRDCETREVSGRCDGSSPWDGNQAGRKRLSVPGPNRPVDGQFPVDHFDAVPASGPRSRLCVEQQAGDQRRPVLPPQQLRQPRPVRAGLLQQHGEAGVCAIHLSAPACPGGIFLDRGATGEPACRRMGTLREPGSKRSWTNRMLSDPLRFILSCRLHGIVNLAGFCPCVSGEHAWFASHALPGRAGRPTGLS